MLVNTFLFYILFCSCILVYGVGFNRQIIMSAEPVNVVLHAGKGSVCVLLSFLLSYWVCDFLLVKIGLAELYPFVCLLIFLVVEVFIELFVEISFKLKLSEFAVGYLIVLLALSEGTSLIDGVIICAACLLAFFALIPVLHILSERMQLKKNNSILVQQLMVILCMVVILTALYSLNISWINQGVLK